MSRKSNAENYARVKNSIVVLNALSEQGNGEFTRKMYDTLRAKGTTSSLEYLRDEGILSVVRKENFEVKVDYSTYQSGIFTENGLKVMEEYEWNQLSKGTKEKLFEAYNGLYVGWEGDSTVTGVRYYYAFNKEAYKRLLERLERNSAYWVKQKYNEVLTDFKRWRNIALTFAKEAEEFNKIQMLQEL